MSKSSFLDHDDPVPSYEETTGTYSAQPRSPLHQRLDQVRLDRVRDILSTHVDPLIEAQAASGLYKTVFLLIPSNVDSLQPNTSDQYSSYSIPKEPEVLGFASTDVVHLVRLKGEEHTLQFWRQPAVIEELAVNLRMRLELSGHRVEQDTDHASVSSPTPPVTEPTSPPPPPVETKKSSSWFRSSKPKKESKSWLEPTVPSEAIVTDHKLGWRGKHEEANQTKPLPRGSVRANVEWKEVCMRVENELGLYETRKGPGVCLSVEFGSR